MLRLATRIEEVTGWASRFALRSAILARSCCLACAFVTGRRGFTAAGRGALALLMVLGDALGPSVDTTADQADGDCWAAARDALPEDWPCQMTATTTPTTVRHASTAVRPSWVQLAGFAARRRVAATSTNGRVFGATRRPRLRIPRTPSVNDCPDTVPDPIGLHRTRRHLHRST
ncbi:hypothetical protein GCM10028801_36670 [Nocardioides maradonensis]